MTPTKPDPLAPLYRRDAARIQGSRSVPEAIEHAFAHIRSEVFSEPEPTDCVVGAFGEPETESELRAAWGDR